MSKSNPASNGSYSDRKVNLPFCCTSCGGPLTGISKWNGPYPYHIECTKCQKHFDNILTPPNLRTS